MKSLNEIIWGDINIEEDITPAAASGDPLTYLCLIASCGGGGGKLLPVPNGCK